MIIIVWCFSFCVSFCGSDVVSLYHLNTSFPRSKRNVSRCTLLCGSVYFVPFKFVLYIYFSFFLPLHSIHTYIYIYAHCHLPVSIFFYAQTYKHTLLILILTVIKKNKVHSICFLGLPKTFLYIVFYISFFLTCSSVCVCSRDFMYATSIHTFSR